MKKLITFIILLITHLSFSQGIKFEKYLSGFGSFEITDVLEHNNQYYLLCNHSYDTFDQQSSFLLRIDSNADSVYFYSFNISHHYVLRAFTNSLFGGLCFVGSIDSLESNFSLCQDGLFVESNFEGVLSKVKSYHMPTKNELTKIISDDTCYYASGNRHRSTSNNIDIHAIKIDSNGNLLDSMSLDFRDLDAVTSFKPAGENLLMSGTILGGYNDGFLAMLSKALDTIFFKKYYLFEDMNSRLIKLWYSYSSKYSSKNTILFPSVFFVRNPIDTNDWCTFEHTGLIRTDKNGNLLSMHIYYLNCGYDRPNDIFETQDGNYIIAGTINFATRRPISPNLNGDFYLMKVDTLGNIIWFKQYGDINYQEMKSAIQTSDGGFLLSGYSITDYTNQERTGYVVKTDANGNVSVGLNQHKNNSIRIYPNPASNFLNVEINQGLLSYEIYSVLGEIVQFGNAFENNIDISKINTGIFLIKLKTIDGNFLQSKFLKE